MGEDVDDVAKGILSDKLLILILESDCDDELEAIFRLATVVMLLMLLTMLELRLLRDSSNLVHLAAEQRAK